MTSGGRRWSGPSGGLASAAVLDIEEDIRRCPLLRESARATLLSELGLSHGRRDCSEFILGEAMLIRRLAEAALVLDCLEGIDVSLAGHAFADPLAKRSALSELPSSCWRSP